MTVYIKDMGWGEVVRYLDEDTLIVGENLSAIKEEASHYAAVMQ